MTSSITQKTRIIEAALDLRGAELRSQIAEHQALDCFLSYDLPTRAATWRGMQDRSRRLIVSAMLIRAYNDYDDASIALWVGRYNERYGTEPTVEDTHPVFTLIEAAQAGALETLATQAEQTLRAATTPDERTFARRELNAANKALNFFISGTRPTRTPDGDYLISSATQAGTVYRIGSLGCSCPAGIAGASCWHASMVTGVIMGWDTVELVDDAAGDDEPEPDYPTSIDLGRRLASARALLMVA